MPISHALLFEQINTNYKIKINNLKIMRKFTFKSLLITAALCLGTSAWAAEGDVTTNADIDFSNAIESQSVAGTVSSMTWTNQWNPMPSITDGRFVVGNFSGGVVPFEGTVGERDVVTASFKLAFGKLSGKYVGFNFQDADGNIVGEFEFVPYTSALNKNSFGIETADLYYGNNTVLWERHVAFTITFDYANKTITTNTSCYKSGTGKAATKATHTVAMSNTAPVAKFVLTSNYNNAERLCQFDDLLIQTTEGNYDVQTADYKVKYVCGDVILKEEIRNDVVDGTISLLASDKTPYWLDGIKYYYVSDDSSGKTIAEDGSTVVTVTFREAQTYNYTVNAVNDKEEILKELATGSNFEGEKSRAYVTKGLNINGVWYITSGNGSYPTYGYDFTEAATKNVTYTVDENVDYFFEVEDINKSRSWAATGAYPDRYSNGLAGRLYKGAYAYTDALAGGIYKITMWARNNSGSQIANVGLYYRDSEGNATSLGVSFEDWAAGKSESKIIENVIIPEGASLMLKNENPDYNSNLEMDYLILQKTGEATVSTTITSAGYATFSSTYAVDFSKAEGLAAYTAKVNDGNQTITLTKIADGIVPANTGVVLKGAAGEYTGTITTTDATVDNDLIANNAEITSDGTIYVLNNGTNGIGFYPLASGKTLAAGKAYLQLASGAKGYSFVWNDGETTGIEENYEFGNMNSDAATFDLSGRKVTNPTKGLYIKNGKKFIVK